MFSTITIKTKIARIISAISPGTYRFLLKCIDFFNKELNTLDGKFIVQYGTSETAIPTWYITLIDGYTAIRITSKGGTIAVGNDGVSIVYNFSGIWGGYENLLWFIDADGRICSKTYPDKVLSAKDDIKLDYIPLVLTDIGTSKSEIWTFTS